MLFSIPQVWDVNMESRPVEVYPVHDYLRSRLCSLYENDSIFDRFECGWNGDDSYPALLYTCTVWCTYRAILRIVEGGCHPVAIAQVVEH